MAVFGNSLLLDNVSNYMRNDRVSRQRFMNSRDRDVAEDGFSEISPEGIAEQFRDFLINNKNVPKNIADKTASHLVDFIKTQLPEINALSALRKTFRPLDKTRYPLWADRKQHNISDPTDWYNEYYKNDVDAGLINTSSMTKIDAAFTNALARNIKPQTLTEFFNPDKPSVKVQALSVVLDTTPTRAQHILSASMGRPKGK